MTSTNSDIAYQKLLELIVNRRILAGQKLNETDLSKQLGMSRTPIREALRRLQQDGIVLIVPNKGSYVQSYTFAEMADGYEIISMLTGMACHHIAYNREQIDDSQFELLEKYLNQMDDAIHESDKHRWINLDIQFHKTIIDMPGIWQLSNTYAHLSIWVSQVLWHITPFYIDINSSTQDHRKIISLLKTAKPVDAREFAQSHQMKTVEIIRSISTMQASPYSFAIE